MIPKVRAGLSRDLRELEAGSRGSRVPDASRGSHAGHRLWRPSPPWGTAVKGNAIGREGRTRAATEPAGSSCGDQSVTVPPPQDAPTRQSHVLRLVRGQIIAVQMVVQARQRRKGGLGAPGGGPRSTSLMGNPPEGSVPPSPATELRRGRGGEQKQMGSLGRFTLTEVGTEISGNIWKVAAYPIPRPP